jgi:hypothetical protein
MPKWYRDRPEATDQKTRENRDDHADLERREFIREAAIRMAGAVDHLGDRAFTPADCWDRAQALWKLKPEDC